LRDHALGVAAGLDDLVLALALRGSQLEAGALDDSAFDVDVSEIVIGNQNRALPF
jgi:hypothetical protein